MDTVERLAALLPEEASRRLRECAEELREVRLRATRPAQLILDGRECFVGEPIGPSQLSELLAALMEYSLYAREEELRQGFFTLRDGARVGVCGQISGAGDGARMTAVGGLCVRVPRQIRGCADGIVPHILSETGPRSLLIASPPGMGKTTCLRECARRLSEAGWRVGIADERHELAACCRGVPTLDVGPRTDVMDGSPKAEAIRRMLRSMSPQIIATDEIGGDGDALALADAARCGVAVIATAHGADMAALRSRRALRQILSEGIFPTVVLLGGAPGQVRAVWHPERRRARRADARSAGADDRGGKRALRQVSGRGDAAARGAAPVRSCRDQGAACGHDETV